jgi:hypothetical protein
MDISGDELAGIVDLFGALTPADLRRACVELAFKRGEDRDPADFDGAIEVATETYHLLSVPVDEAVDGDTATAGEDLLVPGPAAFPELPEGAADLVHILDAEERSVERDRAATAAERRFRAEAAAAVEAGDREAIRRLLDVSYELETWGGVDLGATRGRLDDALDGSD